MTAPNEQGPGLLDLSRNEGELPAPETLARLLDEGPRLLRDYAEAAALEASLAGYLGVDPSRVLATTGGDDAIDRVFKVALSPRPGIGSTPDRNQVVVPDPTFEMVPAYASVAGGDVVSVAYEWGTLPLEQLRAAVTPRTAVVVVVSPDNPTGVAAPTEALLELARSLPSEVTVMVDQAYVEFADEDPSARLLELENVVLIRTLSKAWGLAGLRIGYAVSTPERIARLRAVGGPYAVSGLGVRIACHRIDREAEAMRRFVAETTRRRDRLTRLLSDAGAQVLPSQANFVLARFPDARWILRGLEAQGIRTRSFPHLPGCLRITVPRSEAEMSRLEVGLRRLVRPEAVLFDMDGVLADVRRSYREAIRATCRAHGVEVDEGRIAAVKARGNANDDWQVTWELVAEAGGDASLEEVTATFEDLYQGTASRPGLREQESLIADPGLLRALADRVPLGVVTGRPRRDAERFLSTHGLDGLFTSVICREDALLKPSPEPVKRALEALGVECAWLLGDTPDDVTAACAAGVIPVGVVPPGGGPGERSALEAAGAARVVEADPQLGGVLDV